ncbi:MAG: hypothetical protein AB7I25_07925 [Vicinamibacterales bacterium]
MFLQPIAPSSRRPRIRQSLRAAALIEALAFLLFVVCAGSPAGAEPVPVTEPPAEAMEVGAGEDEEDSRTHALPSAEPETVGFDDQDRGIAVPVIPVRSAVFARACSLAATVWPGGLHAALAQILLASDRPRGPTALL